MFVMESFSYWGRLWFSMPIQLLQSKVTRNATSVEFARNTIGDLDRKLFEQQQRIRKHPRWYKKYYWSALVKNKIIAQCRQKKNIHVPRFLVRFVHKNMSGQVYNRCGLLFSVQSLNNFWMMSIRNCSVGSSAVMLFGMPRPVIFLGRSRIGFFFNQSL